jgi:hypothetical protein
MAEEKKETTPTPGGEGDKHVPIDRLNEVIAQREAVRKELETVGKQLAELQAAAGEKEKAALAEQGKYKDLYDKSEGEVKRLVAIEAQHKAALNKIGELNKSRREKIPENYQDLIPAFTDPIQEFDYLLKFEAKLPTLNPGIPPVAPKGGGGGGQPDGIKTLEEELDKLEKSGNYSQQTMMRRTQLVDQIHQLKKGK